MRGAGGFTRAHVAGGGGDGELDGARRVQGLVAGTVAGKGDVAGELEEQRLEQHAQIDRRAVGPGQRSSSH